MQFPLRPGQKKILKAYKKILEKLGLPVDADLDQNRRYAQLILELNERDRRRQEEVALDLKILKRLAFLKTWGEELENTKEQAVDLDSVVKRSTKLSWDILG